MHALESESILIILQCPGWIVSESVRIPVYWYRMNTYRTERYMYKEAPEFIENRKTAHQGKLIGMTSWPDSNEHGTRKFSGKGLPILIVFMV